MQKALVLGGGVAGLTAALELAERGYATTLVEKGDKLGGNAWSLNKTWKGDDIRPWLAGLIARVENHPRVTGAQKCGPQDGHRLRGQLCQ